MFAACCSSINTSDVNNMYMYFCIWIIKKQPCFIRCYDYVKEVPRLPVFQFDYRLTSMDDNFAGNNVNIQADFLF